MHRIQLWSGVALVALVAGGCVDPIEGTWRGLSDTNCGGGNDDTVRFTVDGDLHGEGDVCDCDFDFDAEHRDGDRYRLDLKFDDNCGVGIPDGKYDCDLQKGDTKLDCGDLGNYERDD